MANSSFEGVSGQAPPEGVDFDLPEYDDDDPYKSGDDPTESHDQGGAEPTVDADAATNREEPFDYGVDSIGRRYPRDEYGYRVIPGSRRPFGVPPNIWNSLSKGGKVELPQMASPIADASAPSSSTMLAKRGDCLWGCEICF